MTDVALAIVLLLSNWQHAFVASLFKIDFHSKHLQRQKENGKNKQPSKRGGIKILDPRRIDYTYTDNINVFDILYRLGETGSGDGQLSGPEGVGVDKESGAVYIADTGNIRIQLFEHL